MKLHDYVKPEATLCSSPWGGMRFPRLGGGERHHEWCH